MTFSYKVEAMDFIIKDNAADVKHRVRQCLLNCYHLSNHFVESVNKNYMVKIGSCVKAVPYDDILFFEASENARKVILKANPEADTLAKAVKWIIYLIAAFMILSQLHIASNIVHIAKYSPAIVLHRFLGIQAPLLHSPRKVCH